ncbi:MAG: methyl-accepting chemotaxis protein [Myxococcota bacterium]
MITRSKYFWVGTAAAFGVIVVSWWLATQQGLVGAAPWIAGLGVFGAVAFVVSGLPNSSLGVFARAAKDAARGRVASRPLELPEGGAALFDALEDAARAVQNGDGQDTRITELERALDEAEKARDKADEARRLSEARFEEASDAILLAEETIRTYAEELSGGLSEQMVAVEQTTTSMKDMDSALQEISQHVEALASSAEESSSSILEMTATNDEVAENMANLAASVRETVSSIEEMAYSIKEVARNVDALSLTAEETSSSMNQMDVSIDQVQSNANETARLSEEVASDAEKGAESILKIINEINRIKTTSSEAVAVISNLGSRIEAIGDILNVIDDVAEQTNLLALNAAIIAAQAGEHGKGFAVVADEIKDLAERAGASTKEIAELIKTIQAESKNAIIAVERGASTVDSGVTVSAEAERALKKILESSQKSTAMVRAIARATVEQAKGSKQVTDAIGRIAETVQQIAAATAEQARGSELIMKSAEKMRLITQHVERSSQEQARGGRQISQSIENISNMVNHLHQSHRAQARGSEQTLMAAERIGQLTKDSEKRVHGISGVAERLKRLAD